MYSYVIIPVNAPEQSKHRLRSILTPVQRESLTLLMFGRVLEAAIRARNVDEVHVTSPSVKVCRIARRMGLVGHLEKGRRNLNAALARLLAKLERGNPRISAVIVHADLPFVTPREVELLARLAVRHRIVLVPSKDGRGTNAIAMTPATLIRPQFGRDSFQRHLKSAKKAKLRTYVCHNRRLRFDVDEPADIKSLVERSRADRQLHADILETLAGPTK